MMTPRIWLALAFLLLAAGTASATPINLVNNGSFEQGTLGIGSFQGWQTSFGDNSTFVDSNGQTGQTYGQATDGKWAAYFGSTAASGGSSIAQTLLTTAGQLYVLSFDLANDNGGFPASNSFSALLNGVSLFTVANLGNQNFMREQIAFTASGSSTTLGFTGFNDQSYAELDNVSVVTATPEPSSFALLGTGLLGLIGVAKRRIG